MDDLERLAPANSWPKPNGKGRRLALVTRRNAGGFGEECRPLHRELLHGKSGSGEQRGYAVIFFYREGSLKPFSRHAPNLFDRLKLDQNGRAILESDPETDRAVAGHFKYSDQIIYPTFVTVDEYLHGLEVICRQVNRMGPDALIYLAAAVSDFYIREEQLPTHKIQSQGGDVQLSLSVVTKILDRLVEAVVPKSFVVSFKLETDPEILISKAKGALKRYKHSLVIGNILKTRKTTVVFVQADSVDDLTLTPEQQQSGVEIERLIVERLHKKHDEFVSKST
ncbi:Phosphopantothenate--cysteine ligase [Aphelenchoides fujianensis]|nr:Phosphopantothenate--cysteine ligase [Aphelenchoides fujianensis]